MNRVRVIPCLLLKGNGLVKTVKFGNTVYIGDPVNAVRIFSEKGVDEIVILDIDASKEGREPNYDLISEIAGECFMPLAYGGGVRTVDQVRCLIRSGVEKIVINSELTQSVDVISQAAELFGSQAVVAGIDVRRSFIGKFIVTCKSNTEKTNLRIDEHIKNVVAKGAGEILINSIDQDGMMNGYDLGLIKSVSALVNVPIVACGGAGSVEHLMDAVKEGGLTAVAGGSMFVFHGKHKAVLISYLSDGELKKVSDQRQR